MSVAPTLSRGLDAAVSPTVPLATTLSLVTWVTLLGQVPAPVSQKFHDRGPHDQTAQLAPLVAGNVGRVLPPKIDARPPTTGPRHARPHPHGRKGRS